MTINHDEISERSKGGKKPESTKLLGGGIKEWWLHLVRPIEDYLIDNRFHPNILTVTTLIVSVITGIFFHYGWIFLAGILLLAGSTFDIFDGRVARALGISSQHGAFFDSCLDRFSEAFIYLGIMSYFMGTYYVYVVFLILSFTMMVSYTRARAEGLGVKCEVGIMQRTERIVYLGVFSVFNFAGNMIASAAGFAANDFLLKASLLLLLIFSAYTSVQRMYHVLGKLRDAENEAV